MARRTAGPRLVLACLCGLVLLAAPSGAQEPTPNPDLDPSPAATAAAPAPPNATPPPAGADATIATPPLDARRAELELLVARLSARSNAEDMSSADAEDLDRELASLLRSLRDEADETLARWDRLASSTPLEADAASDARLAALAVEQERVDMLSDAIDVLSSLRTSLHSRLSPAYLDRLYGLGPEGRRQLMDEIQRLRLGFRLYVFSRARELDSLPTRLHDVVTVGGLAWHGVLSLVVLGVATWVRRRGRSWIEASRQSAFRSLRSLTWKRRSERLSRILETSLPWGTAVLAIEGLKWALGSLATAIEVSTLLQVASLYAGYRLAVDLAAALLLAIAQRYKMRVEDRQRQLVLQSVRTVLRVTAVLILIGTFALRLLGPGSLYHLVTRFAWLVILAAIFGELYRWRHVMVETYLKLSPDGRLATAVGESVNRWYGALVAPAAVVWLAGRALVAVGSEFAMGFDQTQKALAYLFRRKVEKQAELQGYAEGELEVLPEGVAEAFAESAVEPGPLMVQHFPGLSELQQQISAWCQTGVGGSFLVTGERGIGKTSWLNQLQRKDLEITRIELGRRVVEPAELVARLAACLAIDEVPSTAEGLAEALSRGSKRIVVLDMAQHLFLSRVGGYAGFSTFAEVVNRSRHTVFWLCAMSAYAWRHLHAVHPDCAVFRRVQSLEGWSEERIRDLIRTRCEASGARFNYADVAVDSLEGVASRARLVESADGYTRLLWDYSDGNPRVALHFFLRSLDPDRGGRVRVRLFKAPDPGHIEDGGETALFVLAAIVTHESATTEDLAAVTRFSDGQIQIQLDRLRDLGAITDEGGLIRISTTWHRATVRLLKRRNLLPG